MMPMQQFPMASMQQMPLMPMVPAGLPAAPSPAEKEKAKEDAQLAGSTLEDLTALEAEVKELEQKAKASAKRDAYIGLMARYIEDEGFGFISCPECKEKWDKTDIFVSGRTFMSSGIDIGDLVVFAVEKDGKGMPRAVTPKALTELTKLRKKLTRMREILRQ